MTRILYFLLVLNCLWAFGAQGQSFDFNALRFPDGNNYVATPWDPSFGDSQDFSIEFSVRTDGWTGDPSIVSDKDWDAGKNPGFNIALASSGQGIDVNVGDGTNRADLEAGVVNDGNWHHILVSFDRQGLLRLFIDGLLAQSVSMANVGNIDSPYKFNIGQDGTGVYGSNTTCDIVNLRIWNRAMDIEDLEGFTCNEPNQASPYILNLIHYWPMQEGAGTSLTDLITLEPAPFTGAPVWTSGKVPNLQVNFSFSTAASVVTFTNLTTDANWLIWDFGDGATSNQLAPVHTYLSAGTYTVRLVAGNGCSRDTLEKTVVISNIGPLTGFDAAELCSTSRLDYMATQFDPNFGTTTDFTVEFRVRSFGWDGDPAIISDKDWDSGGNKGFVIAFNGASIKMNIGDGTNRADINGAKPMNDGQWHHVLSSFDRDGVASLYFDGELVGTRSMATIGDINSPYNLNIGQDGTGNYAESYSINGATCEVSELRIWNRVVSPSETAVCDTLNSNHPLWNDLLHYWKLNEGAGDVGYDSKGQDTAFFQNTAAWSNQNLFPPAGAQFQYNTLQSTVEFVNLSTPGDYSWDFGDGNTSTEANPAHTYLATGTYTVRLIALNACSADTLEQTVVIDELSTSLLNSLDLDGQDDFVALQNDLNFGTDQDFTLEMFVKTAGWASDPAILANKDWDSGKNPGFVVAGKSDGTLWKFNIGDGTNRIDIDGGAINDGEWHHLAVSFDRDGNKTLYQDGTIVGASSALFTGNIDNNLSLAIGQDGTLNYGAFFQGQVAEVRIWNVALDSTTLADNACGATAGHPFYANLLHYWKADEGQGTEVVDSKATNNGVYNGDWTVSLNTIAGCASAIPLNEVGAGNALDFDGFDDFVTVPKNDIFEFQQDITLEAWVNARTLDQWESFLNYVQDNGSNESGFDFAYVDGKLRFRLTTVNMGGNDWNDNPGFDIPRNEWVHVAGTYDGATIKMYVNGVLVEQENKTGAIDWEFKPLELRIGGYVDDNELYYWDGLVDEVRIWDVARTADQIRETMCRRLRGVETGLIANYRLDERVGTTAYDQTPNDFNGELFNMAPAQDRVVSGAGIGDTSVWVYGPDLTGQTLSLGRAGQGRVNLSNINFDARGMQLYRVDAKPQGATSLELLDNAGVYFGAVPGSPTGVAYDARYNYAGNTAATAQENELYLAARKDGAGTQWTNTLATQDAAADAFIKSGLGGRKELVLAVQGSNACAAPGQPTVQDATFSTITIVWTGTPAAVIQVGPVGFSLGTGVSDTASNGTITLSGLNADTQYEFYLQGICSPGSVSTWVGPFVVSTVGCLPPVQPSVSVISSNTVVFNWQDSPNATLYSIQWGPAGFALGLGIQIQNITGNSYQLSGLPPNTNFDYYIRSSCNTAGQSEWIGPFSFMTLQVGVGAPDATAWKVYPNPVSDRLIVELADGISGEAVLAVTDASGRTVVSQSLQLTGLRQALYLETGNWPAGVYTIALVQEGVVVKERVVKQ